MAIMPIIMPPKAAPKAPPTSTHTGSNPRGVAIAAPVHVAPTPADRAAHAIAVVHATQGTPRGVSGAHSAAPNANDRHAAAVALMQAHHQAQTGGGRGYGATGPLAAIRGAYIASHGSKIAGNLVHDVINLPQSTLVGTEELGSAAAHDLVHAPWEKGYHSALGSLIPQMAKSDPLFNLVTGHVGRAADLAENHPLGAIMDVTGGLGALGRIAGAAGRVGMLGSKIGEASALSREPLIMPTGAAALRHPSPNLLKNLALRKMDSLGNGQGLMAAPHMPFSLQRGRGQLVLPLTDHGDVAVPLTRGRGGFARTAVNRELKRRANEHEMVAQALEGQYEADARARAAAANLGPRMTEKAAQEAKVQGRTQAIHQMVESNALRHPRGGIFYSQKTSLPARAQHVANESGVPMVKLPYSALGGGRGISGHVVIPKLLADQVKSHLKLNEPPATALGAGWNTLSGAFRSTVLPFSTKWIAGNTIEATARSLLHGVGPQHATLAHKLLNLQEDMGLKDGADTLRANAMQGGHFAMNDRLSKEADVRSAAAEGKVAHGLAKASHAWGAPARGSFRFNTGIEHQFNAAVLGKHIKSTMAELKRQHPDATREQLMEATAAHYAHPQVAADAGRYNRKVLGQYAGFGPSGRQFTRNLAMFGPWYRNSAKFVGGLPLQHPIFAQAASATNNAESKKWLAAHKDIKGLGGSLQSDIATGHGGYLDMGRYLPQGAFTGGTGQPAAQALISDALNAIGPQWQGAFKAANGLDPFNRPLQYPGPPTAPTKSGRPRTAKSHDIKTGTPDYATAASEIIGSLLGGASTAKRILVDRGGTSYNTEKLWDLSPKMKSGGKPLNLKGALSGLNKVLNPFKPTVVSPHPTTSKSTAAPASGPSYGRGGKSSGGPSYGSSGSSSGGPSYSAYHLGEGHRELEVLAKKLVSKERGRGRGGHMVPGGSRGGTVYD